MSTTAFISFERVTLGYAGRSVVADLTFNVDPGDLLGIVGPNGSGKTTILRAMLGILAPLSGTVTRHRRDGSDLRLGYVPQRDAIDPIMPFTVADVVMMGRYSRIGLLRRPAIVDREAVRRALRAADIEDLTERSYRDLSGGQRQRALIARALAAEPDVLVLDEPTNGMDLSSRSAILELVRRLHDRDGMTVVMVTHLLSDVANYVNRIALVEPGVFQIGTTDQILSEDRLSQLYRLPVRVAQIDGQTVVLAGGKHV